jgi:hypothetical protein
MFSSEVDAIQLDIEQYHKLEEALPKKFLII